MKTKRTAQRGVKALGGGRYQLRIYADGRDFIRTVEASSVAEASRERDRWTLELSVESRRSTISIVGADWLRRKVEARRPDGTTRLAPTTIARYRNAVELFILPAFGRYRVSDVAPSDVARWRDSLSQNFAASTVNGHLQVFRTMMKDLGNDRATARLIEVDDTRITADEPNNLTRVELRLFIEAARWHERYALILFLLITGARVSTAIATRWEDIDAERGTVTMRRRIYGGTILRGVKRDRREIDVCPLLPELHAALVRDRDRQSSAQRASGYLFPSPKNLGRPITRQTVTETVKEIRARAGLTKRLTVHGLRRTAALHYRLASSTAIAMGILGHQTEAMHQHYAPEQLEERARAAEQAFGELLEGGPASDGTIH